MATAFTRQPSVRVRRRSEKTVANVVAAIDFGTTCTGYAYYIQQKDRTTLDSINTQQAWSGCANVGLQAPTSLLMTPERKFHSFGFEAEIKYEQLARRNEHQSWFFFRYFKMTLHHKEDLYMYMDLEDINGKTMKACQVFTCAIRYVKEHLFKKIEESLGSGVVEPGSIQWVLTVPAIWRESAKQFMRETAEEAGIPRKQLTLALEPESAAIFCKELSVEQSRGTDGLVLKSFDPDQKFLVLDLGGGTVDTTVHEVQRDGTLKALYAATGGPWGGELINGAFENLIKALVTDEVFQQYKKEHARKWIEVQKCFERKKRQFNETTDDTEIPYFTLGLEDVYKRFTKRNLDIPDGNIGSTYKAWITDMTLILPHETMLTLFNEAIGPINDHIKSLLKEPKLKDVSSILLVGGFSESSIVKKSIRERFSKLRVFPPPKASEAILIGAVLFGRNQDVIAVRLSPFTYGVKTRKKFDPKVHPTNRVLETSGERRAINCFSKHIERGQSLYINDPSEDKRYTMKNLKNPNICMLIFQSEHTNPHFCDERGCKQIGKLSFKIPRMVPSNKALTFRIWMTCRGSELVAKAKIEGYPGDSIAKLDFLLRPEENQSEEDTVDMV